MPITNSYIDLIRTEFVGSCMSLLLLNLYFLIFILLFYSLFPPIKMVTGIRRKLPIVQILGSTRFN